MNQVAVEALYSATYVENYLDLVENLPDDAQKFFSRIRELDIQYGNYLREAESFYQQWSNCPTSELESATATKRSRAMTRFQQSLIAAKELGDEKMKLSQSLQELIDHKVRQLDFDLKNLDYGQDELMQTDMGKDPYPFSNIASPVPNSPSAHSTNNHTFSSGGSQAFLAALASNGAASSVVGGIGSSSALIGGNGGDRVSSSNSSHNGSSAGANGNSSYGGAGSGGSGKRARRVRTDAGDMGSSDSNLENSGKGLSSYSANHSSSLNVVGSAVGSVAAGSQQGSRKGQQAAAAAANNSGKKKKRKTRVQGGSGAGMSSAGGNGGGSGGGAGSSVAGGGSGTLGIHSSSGRDMRDDTPPQEDTIDPDEPTYCLCDQISFGEMILCDNDLCPIEWFHFSCVSLISKPKGKWYCPNCRGDRPNIMKNKAQFLKELERYNKEREEKT